MSYEKRNTVMESEKKEMACESPNSVSIAEAFFIQLIISLGLAQAFWFARNVYSIDLISDPSQSHFLIVVVEPLIVILLFSRYRTDREQCLAYLNRLYYGGAIIHAYGAIALGALIGVQYLLKTLNWSLVMSLFTIVPSTCVFGSSWMYWQLVLANGTVDYMICIPALGAIIGALFGAWPTPLDWEKSMQEKWPICLGYVAALGYSIYSIAMVAYLAFSLMRSGLQHVKRD